MRCKVPQHVTLSSFRFINQSNETNTLLDKDYISHSFKPLNHAFSSGCSSDNHSPYPLNNIVISINGNNPPNNHETSSGHALSSHFQRHPSLTQQVESLGNNADFLTKLAKK